MIHYLFDVDGTLTPARSPIDKGFKQYFGRWVNRVRKRGDEVFLVTGSDKPKTLQQIGTDLYRCVNGVYQNGGNQLYIRNNIIKQEKWKIGIHLHLDLLLALEKSQWNGTAGVNLEERVGMANFSTVGRDATPTQRKQYYEWDKIHNERKRISEWLSIKYPRLEFVVGGEISIDIFPKGKDKSQVLNDMIGETIFFGNNCNIGGNDYSIAMQSDKYHNVEGWRETMKIIRDYYG